MNWRAEYRVQYEAGSEHLPQQGDGEGPKQLDQLSSAEVKSFIATHQRQMGRRAGADSRACRTDDTGETVDTMKAKISSIRGKFNKCHGMYLNEGRDNHYAEMRDLHDKLLPLESKIIEKQSVGVMSLRSQVTDLMNSGFPTRKAEKSQWEEKLVGLNKEIAKKSGELALHAADQFKRLSALGLDVENEHQVLGSSNVEPAAGPQPE